MLVTGLLFLLLLISYAIHLYNINTFWHRQRIPYSKPLPLFGNICRMVFSKSTFAEILWRIYNEKSIPNEPIVGLYILTKPALLIRDPRLVKLILIKDFEYFSNRHVSCDQDEIMSKSLFFATSKNWKELRSRQTSFFTTKKIKEMYPLMINICSNLEAHLERLPFDNETFSCICDVKEISGLFTTDLISSIAFGLQSNTLENPNNSYRFYAKKFFILHKMRAVKAFVIFFFPNLAKHLRLHLLSQECANFFRKIFQFHIDERKRKNETNRNDIFDSFISLRREKLTTTTAINIDTSILGQAFFFLMAGSETSSVAITFALYELAKNHDVLSRLRNEIQDAFTDGNGYITHQRLHQMEYLDMVVKEALRLNPVLPFLERQCKLSKDEQLKNLGFQIPHGTPVYVSVLAMHRDPKYWTNPNDFDPERFSAEKGRSHLSYTYLPFGTGPRACIGSRIAIIQIKLALIHILRNHYVDVCERTNLTLKFDTSTVNLELVGGNYLKLVKDHLK